MNATVEPGSLIKQPKAKRAKGRARPAEALADWCEAHIDGVCIGRAACRHHKLRRGAGGTDDRENTVDLCTPCHEWIHANPEVAYLLGWLLRRSA